MLPDDDLFEPKNWETSESGGEGLDGERKWERERERHRERILRELEEQALEEQELEEPEPELEPEPKPSRFVPSPPPKGGLTLDRMPYDILHLVSFRGFESFCPVLVNVLPPTSAS